MTKPKQVYIAFVQGGVPVFVSNSYRKACNFAEVYIGKENVKRKDFKSWREDIKRLHQGDTTQITLKSNTSYMFAFVRRYELNKPYGLKWEK